MMKLGDSHYCAGQFLVAMPGMQDERFARSVIYMCAHSSEGAMGIVVNHAAPNLLFSAILDQLDIKGGQQDIVDRTTVLRGGPFAIDFSPPKSVGRSVIPDRPLRQLG